MAFNLLNLVKNQLTGNVIEKIAGLVGTGSDATSSAIDKLLPSIVDAVKEKGKSGKGSKALLDLISDKGMGSKSLSNMTDILSDGDKAKKWKKSGNKIAELLTGKEQDPLYNYVSPIVLGTLGKVASDNNYSADQLSSYLSGKTAEVQTTETKSTSSSSSSSRKSSFVDEDEKTVIYLILPILLFMGWYLTNKNLPKNDVQVVDRVETVEQPVAKKPVKKVARGKAKIQRKAGAARNQARNNTTRPQTNIRNNNNTTTQKNESKFWIFC